MTTESSGSMGQGFYQAVQLQKNPTVTQAVAAQVSPFSRQEPIKKKDRAEGAPPSDGTPSADSDGDLNTVFLTSVANNNKQKLVDKQQSNQANAEAKARVTLQNFQTPPELVAQVADDTYKTLRDNQNPDHDFTFDEKDYDRKEKKGGALQFVGNLLGGGKKPGLQANLGIKPQRDPESPYYVPSFREMEALDEANLASVQAPTDGSKPPRIASPITKNGVFLATSDTGDNLTDGITNQQDTAAASLIARTKAKPVPVDKRRFEALQRLIDAERNWAEDNESVAV